MDIVNAVYVQSLILAQAAPEGGGPSSTSLLGGPFFMLMLFFVVMYFLVLRPQNRKEAERRLLLEKLQKGDAVVTIGGICGVIVGLSDKHVVVRVDDNVKIEFVRSAISEVSAPAAAD